MIKTTIADPRVRLRPPKKLLEHLNQHMEHFKELPENIAKVLKLNGYKVPPGIKINTESVQYKKPKLNTELLKKLTADVPATELPTPPFETSDEEQHEPPVEGSCLYLTDMHWLCNALKELRQKDITSTFMHELIENAELILPQNVMQPRNPEVVARCERLRLEQENQEYERMTKGVDAVKKHHPEDTIAYQIKSLNKQIIAVLQFVFSVAAGFTFGFFGVNLMVGPLPFGFRLLLGVMVALIIAIAEMYFLAKKLNELDDAVDAPKRTQARRTAAATNGTKLHAD